MTPPRPGPVKITITLTDGEARALLAKAAIGLAADGDLPDEEFDLTESESAQSAINKIRAAMVGRKEDTKP